MWQPTRRRVLRGGVAWTGAALPASLALGAPAAYDVDFRYAPREQWTAICFPDDPMKTLVNEAGALLFTSAGERIAMWGFPQIVWFEVGGIRPAAQARQWMEKPSTPVVHTELVWPNVVMELTAFATNREGEGRVDNVLIDLRARSGGPLRGAPLVILGGREPASGQARLARLTVSGRPFGVMSAAVERVWRHPLGQALELEPRALPARYLLRFPASAVREAPCREQEAEALLEETRRFWAGWRPDAGETQWRLPGVLGDFHAACARNLQQAREVRDGRLTFQVGATVYRGLWVVDGHFILEAARYLGETEAAQRGLETTWSLQESDGGIFAGAGRQHWKDTAIAMFTLVRHAELAGDWSYFRRMSGGLRAALRYIRNLRAEAAQQGGAVARFGLLPHGMGDGGLGGIRPEFTNTLWTLVGLKAAGEAAQAQGVDELAEIRTEFESLFRAFRAAAAEEMQRHPQGFSFLPMLMKEDAAWSVRDERKRPRWQAGQWALSQAIYPGLLFAREDPIVQGHIALMQACTEEDVPVETGWIPDEGLWTYNAAFVAEVYLWAGLKEWARRTFQGFLNHATPQYCWREEQPLRRSALGRYVGDMPHNWASAECLRYLRHMLALEDGTRLRLLEGLGEAELALRAPWQIRRSPTRFGAVSVQLETEGRRVRLQFERGRGPAPEALLLPAALGGRRKVQMTGAAARQEGGMLLVDPAAEKWSVVWS